MERRAAARRRLRRSRRRRMCAERWVGRRGRTARLFSISPGHSPAKASSGRASWRDPCEYRQCCALPVSGSSAHAVHFARRPPPRRSRALRLRPAGDGASQRVRLGRQSPDSAARGEIGAPLFDRLPRGVRLAAAGETIVDGVPPRAIDALRRRHPRLTVDVFTGGAEQILGGLAAQAIDIARRRSTWRYASIPRRALTLRRC